MPSAANISRPVLYLWRIFLQQAGIIGCGQALWQGLPAARLPQGAAFRAGLQVGFYQRFTFRAGNAILHQRDQIPADRAGNFGFCFSLFCLPVCFFFLRHSSYPSFLQSCFQPGAGTVLHHPRGCFGYLQFLGNFLVRIPLRPQVYHAAGALVLCCSKACTRRSFWRAAVVSVRASSVM